MNELLDMTPDALFSVTSSVNETPAALKNSQIISLLLLPHLFPLQSELIKCMCGILPACQPFVPQVVLVHKEVGVRSWPSPKTPLSSPGELGSTGAKHSQSSLRLKCSPPDSSTAWGEVSWMGCHLMFPFCVLDSLIYVSMETSHNHGYGG